MNLLDLDIIYYFCYFALIILFIVIFAIESPYIIIIIICILVIIAFAFITNNLQYFYDNIMTIFILIAISFFIVFNVSNFSLSHFFLISTITGYFIIIAKGLLGAMQITSNTNNSIDTDSNQNNFKSFLRKIKINEKLSEVYDNQKINTNTVMLFKEYLPFFLGSALLAFFIYFYRITQLRIDLSLASNCKKKQIFIENSTIRKKIYHFADTYNDELKNSLIILLVSSLLTLCVIVFIIYNNDIEIYYIWLIPILIFIITFSSIQIDYLNKNMFAPVTKNTKDQNTENSIKTQNSEDSNSKNKNIIIYFIILFISFILLFLSNVFLSTQTNTFINILICSISFIITLVVFLF